MPDAPETPRSDNSPADRTSAPMGDAPHPGSKEMPQWTVGELAPPPVFGWRNLALLIGPGLVMGAAAVGGGEWLLGPRVTAKYGGALLWLATISILGQVLYNIEICRYTLYSGEPIFTGKFRTLPGPRFWLGFYLLLDIGSFLPYLASNAAVPLMGVVTGEMPDLSDPTADEVDPEVLAQMKEAKARIKAKIRTYAAVIFIVMLLPLVVGGKVYRSLKFLMSFKLIVVVGFLLFLAVFFSSWDTWWEIVSGFFRFGTLPIQTPAGQIPETANIFVQWWHGRSMPILDLSMIGFITGMAAIAGNGGLTNTPISNFTRDQGWGMGKDVGAIPSIVGGHAIELSHTGKVFHPTTEAMPRWRGWVKHVQREQLLVWMPACFIGMALPSMLSVQFLPRGTTLSKDQEWLAAGMTAEGVGQAVAESLGPSIGHLFFLGTLFCGFLVLVTAAIMTADGVLRRWLDAMWVASSKLRKWETKDIGRAYFGALCIYAAIGLVALLFFEPGDLVKWSTNIYNYALGFSCFHVIFVNTSLLPPELRPSLARRVVLGMAGMFFTTIAVFSTAEFLGAFKA